MTGGDRRMDVGEGVFDGDTSDAVVVEPGMDGRVGALCSLSVAGIRGWGRC